MEKPTDSSNTSPTSSVGNGGSTTSSSEANQQEILQKHHHNHPNNAATTITSTTPTKNQLNNSLGCGPSSTTTTAATSSSLDIGVCNSNVAAVGGCGNLKPHNILTSFNKSTLGHQSSNNTSTTTNTAATLSNIASSSGSAATASTTTISSPSQMAPINLNISTTTGGNFSVSVDPQITVENLKKIIAKKLKVAKDRICLLHREKELQDGLLRDNNLMDGSKIILIPNVETGLLAQRPENTVMQALESLNDSQVNDFLSGKTPLNLSMRLGDHMMLIQLQLSTVNPVNGVGHNAANCSSSSSRQRSSHHHHHHRSSRTATTASAATQTATPANHSHHHHHHHHHHHNSSNAAVAGSATTSTTLTPTALSVATAAQNVAAVRKLELDTTCQTPGSNNNISTLIAPHPSRTAASINTSTCSSMSTSTTATKNTDLSSFLSKRDYESLQNIVKSIAMAQPSRLVQQSITTSNTSNSGVQSSSIVLPSASSTSVPVVAAPTFHAASEAVLLEQSPIKSLSNLVSSPIKTTAIKNIPKMSSNTNSSSANNSVAIGPHTAPITAVPPTSSNASIAAASTPMCQDPIAAKLTSCLCTRLNGGSLGVANNAPHNSSKQCIETACVSQQQLQTTPLLHQQHRHQQLQPHATRTTTSTIMTSTSNYKATLTPNSIATLNGAASSSSSSSSSSSTSRSSSSLHKTAHNPITRKHRHHHHHHHHHHHYHHAAEVQSLSSTSNSQKVTSNTSTPIKVLANDSGFNSADDSLLGVSPTKSKLSSPPTITISQSSDNNLNTTPVVAAAAAQLTTSNSLTTASNVNSTTPTTNVATPIELDDSGIVSDSRTLAEASRNLTQTLRKLSKEVFTNKIDFSASEETPRKSGSGAVIESMKNHGKGIYSGTFSGTLNPALQDRYGRPKRDISTVIHILNDLLSATPQYHRGARISFEAPSTSAAAASVAAASGSTGTVHHSSRSKHLSSKHHQSSHPCVKCIKNHSSSSPTVSLQSVSTSNNSGTTNSHGTSSSSSVCAYGECNGHYVSSKSQSTKTYACCQQDSTIVASSTSAAIPQHQVGHNIGSSNTTSNTSNGHHHHHHGHHGTSHHHHHHHHHQMVDERKVCQCRYRVHSETGEREREYICQKCVTELDNIKTKSKLDQLRLVMQQRKQKREARKLKGAPYGARVVGTTTPATASGVTDNTASTLTATNSSISTPISVATTATAPSEVSPNHLVEEVDTAA